MYKGVSTRKKLDVNPIDCGEEGDSVINGRRGQYAIIELTASLLVMEYICVPETAMDIKSEKLRTG